MWNGCTNRFAGGGTPEQSAAIGGGGNHLAVVAVSGSVQGGGKLRGLGRCVPCDPVPEVRLAFAPARENRLAVGAKNNGPTPWLMAGEHPKELARGHVPDAGLLVVTARDKALAVGTEDDQIDLVGMGHGLADGLPGNGVPEPCCLVVAAGHDCFAVRADGDG